MYTLLCSCNYNFQILQKKKSFLQWGTLCCVYCKHFTDDLINTGSTPHTLPDPNIVIKQASPANRWPAVQFSISTDETCFHSVILDMKKRVVQIFGFLISSLGWLFVLCSMAMDYWRITQIGGQAGSYIIKVAWYWSNLWKDCFTDSTAVSNCRDFAVLWSVTRKLKKNPRASLI